MPREIKIDSALCIQCRACMMECPSGVFTWSGQAVVVERPQKCMTCGHCAAVCPTEAVQHNHFPQSALFSVEEESQPDMQAVLNWMQTRRSVRSFTRQAVRKDHLQLILKAARSAPIASNIPTTYYTVVQTEEKLKQLSELVVFHFANLAVLLRNRLLRKVSFFMRAYDSSLGMKYLPVIDQMVDSLKAGEDPILHQAPCVLLLHGREKHSFALENAQLSAQNASLMCHTLGLGSFYAGFLVLAARHDRSIARLAEIPEQHAVFAALAIGIPELKYPKGLRHSDPPIRWV